MARKQRKRPSCQRSGQPKTPAKNSVSLQQLYQWLLPHDSIFAKIRFHGNIKWAPSCLVWLALCWSWSEARHVTDAFSDALGWCQSILGCCPVNTYQGFLGALTTWTPQLMPVLFGVLQQRMQQLGGKFWRQDGWVPIAFDGSRSTAPRTKSNEQAFCAKNYGKGHTAKYRKKKSKGMRRQRNAKKPAQPQQPQAWITMMWHMALRLPWSWRLGPSNSSEREHVMDMVATGRFPEKTLFCGDAGFVGYPLWTRLRKAGDFLVRVGANVNLLTEHALCEFQKQGKELFVLCWPKTAIKDKQPPLRLRLVQVFLGKTSVWLLTSVLEPQELTIKMMVRFYKMRWGVEVEFRGLKQTLERARLRCRNSQRLLAELDWSILAMAVAELLALKEQLQKRPQKSAKEEPAYEPSKRSLAQTMRALRGCLKNLHKAPEPGKDLAKRLQEAVTDSYERKGSKKARYRPPNPDKKPLGDPQIRELDEEEKDLLQQFAQEKAA
jgi:hypothetical protein